MSDTSTIIVLDVTIRARRAATTLRELADCSTDHIRVTPSSAVTKADLLDELATEIEGLRIDLQHARDTADVLRVALAKHQQHPSTAVDL